MEILILVMTKQSALLFGFQHQNESFKRDTFLGNISPITGGLYRKFCCIYLYRCSSGILMGTLILLQVLHQVYIIR